MRAMYFHAIVVAIVVTMVIESSARRIRMMQFASLTSSGVLVNNPDSVTAAFMVPIAVKHFNERDPTVLQVLGELGECNATIDLVGGVRDDGGISSIAMQNFVVNSSFKAVEVVQGPVRSSVAQPIAVTAGALKIPQISHSATSEALSNKQLYPQFFRTVPSDSQRAEAVATLYKQWGYRKVGIIYVNEAFGISWKNSLFQECEKRKIRLVSVSYEPGLTGGALDDQVTRGLRVLIAERIGVITHVSLDGDFIYSLARAAVSLNWITGKLYVGHTSYIENIDQIKTDPDTVLKFLNGSLVVLPAVFDSGAWDRLRALWPTFKVSDFDEYLSGNFLPDGSPFTLPSDFFQQGQETKKYKSWTLAYDSVIAVGLAACGHLGNLYDNLVASDFIGTSGRIKFNSALDRDSSTTFFALINTYAVGSNVHSPIVARLEMSGNWTFDAPLLFSDGSSNPPIDVEPPAHVIDSIPFGARVFGWLEAFVSMLASAGALLYVRRHHSDQVIIESQPLFMELLACGCVIMGASIVPLTMQTDLGCMLYPWLFALGFTLALSALTAKSARVAILWYHRGPVVKRNKSVRATVLLLGIVFCISVEVAILTAWQVLAPLQFTISTSQQDADGNPLYSSAICTSSSSATTIFFAMLVVFICLVVFGTMWVSFWVRNAPEKYQEAKMTAVAGVCMFQVFFVGLPATAAVWNMSLPRFLVLSSITFLLCMIILVTMFVPKIFKSRFSGMNSSQNQTNDPNLQLNQGLMTEYRVTAETRRVRSEVKAVRSRDDGEDSANEEHTGSGDPKSNKTSSMDTTTNQNNARIVDEATIVQI